MSNALVRYYRSAFPEQAAGLSDDDITLKYGQQAEDFRAKGTDIFKQYPDFASDFERIRNQQVRENMTVGDWLSGAYSSTARGFVGGLGSMVKAPAQIAEYITSGDVALTGPIERATEAATEAITPEISEDQARVVSDSMIGKISEGAGSIGSFLAGGLGVGAGLRAAGVAARVGAAATGQIGTALTGSAVGFTEQYDRAKKAGADDEKALAAGFLGAGLGATEIVPLGGMLQRLNGFAPSAIPKLSKLLRESLAEGGEEALQEAFQSGAGDVIAKEIIAYDPELKLFSSLGEEAAAGGFSGLLFSLLTQSIGRVRTRAATVPETGKDAPGPAAPEDTLKSGEQNAPALGADVLASQYDIEEKALNDLVARELAEGGDAVAPEKALLKADALRIYNQKLGEALLRKRVQEQAAAKAAATPTAPTDEDRAKAAADAEVLVGKVTAEADELLKKVDAGGVPGFITQNLRRIAEENGIAVQSSDTPNTIIERLRNKQSAPSTAAATAPTDVATPSATPPAPEAAAVTTPPTPTPTPDAVPIQATSEVGVRDEAAVRPGVGGQDQVGGQAAEVGQGQGQEGQGQVATAAPAPAAEPATPSQRLSAQIEKFSTENDGEDSREYLTKEIEDIENQANALGEIRSVLAEADARRKDEAKKAEESGKEAKIQVLTISEIKRIAKLDAAATSSNKIFLAIEQIANDKAGQDALNRIEKTVLNLQANAVKRLLKAKDRAASIGQGSGRLTADQLLGWDSINYAPADGGPGFFTVDDKKYDQATKLSSLTSSYQKAKGENERKEIANEIGSLLATGSRVGSRGGTKRLSVWKAPDGSIAVLGAFDQSTVPSNKGKPDKMWRYSVGSKNLSAAQKRDQIGGGMVGVQTMLDAGWTPVGSIALTTPRGRIALKFANEAAFNDFVGTAAREQQTSIRESFSSFESTGSINRPTESERANLAEEVAAKDTMGRQRDEGGAGEVSETNLRVEAFKLVRNNLELSKEIVAYWDMNPGEMPTEVMDKFLHRLWSSVQADPELSEKIKREGAGAINRFQTEVESLIIGLKKTSIRDNFRKVVQNGFDESQAVGAQQGDAGEAGSGAQDAGTDGGGGSVDGQGAPEGQQAGEGGAPATGGEAQPAAAGVEPEPELTPEQLEALRKDAVAELNDIRTNGLISDSDYADALYEINDETADRFQIETALQYVKDKSNKAIRSVQDASIEQIRSMVEAELISVGDAEKAIKRIEEAEERGDIESAVDEIVMLAKKSNEENAADYDSAPDGGDEDHADSYRLLPDTPENVAYNIARLRRNPRPSSSPRGILGTISESALRELYPNLADALKRIALLETNDTRGNRKTIKGMSTSGLLAEAMSTNASLTGATLRFVNDPNLSVQRINPKTGQPYRVMVGGQFNGGTSIITINLAGMRDVSDLHQTILHEVSHAYLDRLDMRFDIAPATLSDLEKQLIRDLRALSEVARTSGLVWQDSSSDNPRVRFREFVAAAMNDEAFKKQLATIRNPLTSTGGSESTVWQDFKALVSKVLASVVQALRSVGFAATEDTPIDQSVLSATTDLFTQLVDNYSEMTGAMDGLLSAQIRSQSLSYSQSSVPTAETLAANDARYLDLARRFEAGDASVEPMLRQMVDAAAKDAGYTIGPVWHGTPTGDFTVFDSKRGGKNTGGVAGESGFWFTSSRNVARVFGPNAIPAYLKIQQPLTEGPLEWNREYSNLDMLQRHKRKSGDGAVFKGITFFQSRPDLGLGMTDDSTQYVVFNPSQIKSAAPITRDAQGNIIPLSQRFDQNRDSISYSARRPAFEEEISYRIVEGMLKDQRDISVDKGNPDLAVKEGRQMMATTNEVDDTLKQMLTAWTNATGAGGRNHQQFVSDFLSGFFKGQLRIADDIRKSINDAVTKGGVAGPIPTNITDADLEHRGEAKRSAKDQLRILRTLEAAIAKERALAERAFSKGAITQQITDSNNTLFKLTKNYRDITLIQSTFVTEMRRALKESEDTGVNSIAKALGLTTGRKAAVDAAINKIQGNIGAYTDSLIALSNLGLDFSLMRGGLLTPTDVSNAVNASSDPRLAAFKSSPAELAVAIMFARKRPLVMDLLAARGAGGDLVVLDKIIELATQDRPDAFDNAIKLLPKLSTIGRLAQRIATQISEEKAYNKKLIQRAERYLETADFWKATAPIMAARIRKLERMLGMEATIDQEQWAAVNGARYFVPESPTDTEDKVFNKSSDNKGYKLLQLGELFRFNEIQSDVFKMKAWLKANKKALEDTPNYELMKRQVDRLTQIASEGANYQIQRGPGALVVTFLGDIATRSEFTGTQAGRMFAQQIRKFDSLYAAFLKGPEQGEFKKFDGLLHDAQIATKTFGRDFLDRFYNRALGFLEARPDLIDPALSVDAQLNKDMAEIMRLLSSDPAMKEPGAAAAVERLLRQAVITNDLMQKKRQGMGLKVREEVNGRYVFREPIGVSQHAMSRGINLKVRTVVQGYMATSESWESEIADGSKSLTKQLVSDLYVNDRAKLASALDKRFTPRVIDEFVKPLVKKEGQSNFLGPVQNDVVDRAQRSNVIDAFNASGGDMIKFAEILHQLEGGNPKSLPDFVGSTLATFQKYYSQIKSVASPTGKKGELVDDGFVLARSFLEARQGEDYPHEWLDFRTYGANDNIRYTRMLAMQAAFGSNGGDAIANIDKMIAELDVLRGEYEVANSQPNPAERERLLNLGGLKTARKNAARNMEEAKAVKENFRAMTKTLNGVVHEQKVLMSLIGLLSGYTVQGATTAGTDTVTMTESIFRKFGFSKEAVAIITGNLKNFTLEGVVSAFQAIGAQLKFNAEWQRQTQIINESGLVDPDALVQERFLKSFARRYAEHLGDAESFAAMWRRTKGAPMERVGSLVTGGAKRAATVLRMGLDTGIGVAKDPAQAAVTLKLQAPFTWVNQLMHRAVARTWLSTVDDAVRKAEAYMRAHPAAAVDPSFKFTAEQIQYSGRGLLGISLDGKNFDYLVETLARNGITLEEAARRRLDGKPALTENQVYSVVSLAQSEILLNTSVTTRPSWALNTAAGRMASPIIGWSLYRMTDLLKTTRNARGQAEINALKQAIIAFTLGVIPVSLAYALLRDEWEEEVIGKKPNVLPLRADNTLPLALLDNLSRVGAFGVAGDFANSMFNVTTGREFSIDSRVFFISSMMNIKNIIGTIWNQDGAMTYQSVWRPLLQSLGGSGYINNFNSINSLLDIDNAERRVVGRINVDNQLTAVGRVLGYDVRSRRGIQAMPNPMKPWVSQMVLAAYANDAAEFQKAYTKAVQAATKMAIENKTPDADPRADVAEAFQRMHPLRKVFNKAPTKQEYQRALLELGDGAAEVAAAIRMFNAYGAQIPRGRGKPGIEPFYGTDRRADAGSTSNYRSAAMRMGSMPSVPDYRRMTTTQF